jgi:hypothetical protein
LRTRGTRGSGWTLGSVFTFAAERQVIEILLGTIQSHSQGQGRGIVTLNGSIDRLGFSEHQEHPAGFIKDDLMRFRPPENTSTSPFTDQNGNCLGTLSRAAPAVGFRIDDHAHAGSLNAEGIFSNLRGIESLAFVVGSAFIPIKGQGNIGRIITCRHHGARAFPSAFRISDARDTAEVELGIDIEMFAIPQRGPFDQPFPVLMKSLRFQIDFESQILCPCRTA